MGHNLRWAVLISLAIWLVCLIGWSAALASEVVLGCPSFAPADSNYGDARWTWNPPGNTCTWTLAEGKHVESPPPARYGILALLILWPASTLGIARAAKRDRRRADVE
jgi:hypothetical protein